MTDLPAGLPPAPVKLIAVDLDGTVLGHDQSASPRVLAALHEAAARGVKVTIATGRNVPSTRKYAEMLGINAPAICGQGGAIHDFASGQTLRSIALDRGLACEIISFADAHPHWHTILYHSDEVYVERKVFSDTFYGRMLSDLTPHLVSDLCRDAGETDPDKLIFAMDAEHTTEAVLKLREFVGHRAIVVQSHAMFAEVNPLGAHKGAGLAGLADLLGLRSEEVMAIGDQENDLTMLAWAGMGVAMGQASDKVKQAARWVAPSIDEDGAAVAIERFVLHP